MIFHCRMGLITAFDLRWATLSNTGYLTRSFAGGLMVSSCQFTFSSYLRSLRLLEGDRVEQLRHKVELR